MKCPESRVIWEAFAREGLGTKGLLSRYKDWIQQIIRDHKNDADWPTKFITSLWWIWKWRNVKERLEQPGSQNCKGNFTFSISYDLSFNG